MKQHELIAIEKTVKAENTRALTELHKSNQRVAQFQGQRRTYRPLVEDEVVQPSEVTMPTAGAEGNLTAGVKLWAEVVDLLFQKESTNQIATADVVVDGATLATGVPVTVLIQLEAKLNDLGKYIETIPELPNTSDWTFDNEADCYRSNQQVTLRTRKVNLHKVLYEATKEHAAQIREWTEDKPVGEWTAVLYSSAIPSSTKRDMVKRCQSVLVAVRAARERANSTDVRLVEKLGTYLVNFVVG